MNTKSVFTPYVARKLLHMGNPILEIKPMKETTYNNTIVINV